MQVSSTWEQQLRLLQIDETVITTLGQNKIRKCLLSFGLKTTVLHNIRLQLQMKPVKIIRSVSSVNIPDINVDFPTAVTYILCLLVSWIYFMF
jgi:hypothetical protein